MNDLRAVFAIFIFFISSYLVLDLFLSGFSWLILGGAILGFILVHFLWPKETNSNSPWYEALEFIFDLPYRCIAFAIRGIAGLFKKSNGDIGLDL